MVRPVACFGRLLRVCRRWGRSAQDAEDLIQEALLRLEEYRRTAKVRNTEAFLARTVRNLAIDQHRRRRVLAYAHEPVEELALRFPLVDPSPTPDRILDGEQHLKQIQLSLESVSRRVRKIYFLNLAGYSYSDIAHSLGISIPTVEREMARAVLTLMKGGALE